MNAWDFLDSADTRLKQLNQTTEVDYRNAASRAYYAAYHACKNIAEQKKINLSAGATHEKLILGLKNSRNKDLQRLGNILQNMRDSRHKADYKINDTFSYQEAKKILGMAIKLKKDLDHSQ